MRVNSYGLGGALTAAALILPLVAAPALSDNHKMEEGGQPETQQSEGQPDEGQQSDTPPGEAQQEDDQQSQSQQDQTGSDQAQDQQAAKAQDQQDALLAKVGGAEIRNSDVNAVIASLPEPVRQQPPQLLVPIAIDQLVLRELILQEAESQNLGEDEEVQQMVDSSSEAAREDAMVQVWLNREIDRRVTGEAVQQVYDDLKKANPEEELPPLDVLKPQIEQFLSQQAVTEIGNDLKQGAEITLYGPDGNPVDIQ